MAKIVFGMNVSLDGYVDHEHFAPDPVLFDHWIDHVRELAGSIYGRRMYEIMRYWDEEDPEWGDAERAFATAWRDSRKWVVSRSLTSVGPNTELLKGDLETEVRRLKEAHAGEISVSGPNLAGSFSQLDLIDEYRLYLHPVVLGEGVKLFSGPRPRLRLVGSERIGDDVIRVTYVPT